MYRRILVPFDGGETSQQGLREAIQLATELQAELRILVVVDTSELHMGFASADGLLSTVALMRQRSQELAAAACTQAHEAGARADFVVRDIGADQVADLVLAEADEYQAELIVMGTHGRRGLSRAALGSEAESVSRRSKVPLLLVRTPQGKPSVLAPDVPTRLQTSG
ncbi:universal stress protein [Ideonella azotifigens]|uniref:Universal stress protein n=1 Tax=Ideonella azotifigens TaxID=513160 RepID=A0ABN1K076_9BURK|nr:universal stress protein [Ideonella azotifigens]MCD2344862.1 universal stress protein [Ideonella azotifigens]